MPQWFTARLGDVLHKTETVNPTASPDKCFEYIDVSSISNKTFSIFRTQKLIGRDAPSRARRLVRGNDVLFATIRPTLRRVAQVPEELDGQVWSTGYFVLRPKDAIDGKFLFYFLLTDMVAKRMESLQRGASYPAVSDGDVRTLKISFPSVDEQRAIGAFLDKAFLLVSTVAADTQRNLSNIDCLLEPFRKVVESLESVVIRLRASESDVGDARCGRLNIAARPTGAACAIRAI